MIKNPETQAVKILERLFPDRDVGTVSMQVILSKMTRKTFYNYASLLYKYGLVDPQKEDKKDSRKVTSLKLTVKGRQALADLKNEPVTSNSQTRLKIITLQVLTDYVDEFNRQNPSWEMELVPRRVKKGVTSQR